MEKKDKKQQAEEVYLLQKALVHFSDRAIDQPHELKTDRERRISTLANALLMQLHLYIEEQHLENSATISPTEELADKLLGVSNALRVGDSPVADEAASDFGKVLDLLDFTAHAKNTAKTSLAKEKLKDLGG